MSDHSELPASSQLNIAALSRLFADKTNSYKLILFLSLLDILRRQQFAGNPISFSEVLIEMLANSWYPHTYFKLSFGLQDKITSQLDRLRLEIGEPILSLNDPDKKLLREAIGRNPLNKSLVRYAPYRLLRPFFVEELRGLKEYQVDSAITHLAEQLFDDRKPLYRVDPTGEFIVFHETWVDYLRHNYLIVRAWVAWHWLEYMQKRNPNSPGISFKLFPPQQREALKEQTAYWRIIVEHVPIRCIYSGDHLNSERFSLDHYLPWSFVVHDQLWNLIPTLPAVNSAKSNHIPAKSYFDSLIILQHQGLVTTHRHLSERCWTKHVTSFVTDLKLTSPRDVLDLNKLRDAYKGTMLPLLALAEGLGFTPNWRYSRNADL